MSVIRAQGLYMEDDTHSSDLVRVIEIIGSGMRMKWKIKSTSDGDMRLSIVRENRLMGIVSESVSVTSMLFKTLRSLSEGSYDPRGNPKW